MNPVVHFEMPYDNVERVIDFYKQTFGWQLQKLGDEMGNYVLATTSDHDIKPDASRGAINGGFFPRKADWPAQYPAIVIAVEDIKQAMKKIEEAGGEVLGEPMKIPDVGQYVSFLDTEGNRVSILEPIRA